MGSKSQNFPYMVHIRILRFLNQQSIYNLSYVDIRNQHSWFYRQTHILFKSEEKNFFMVPVGDPKAQKNFSSFSRINPQTMIRTHVQLHFNKKIRILSGARKWPYPPFSFIEIKVSNTFGHLLSQCSELLFNQLTFLFLLQLLDDWMMVLLLQLLFPQLMQFFTYLLFL